MQDFSLMQDVKAWRRPFSAWLAAAAKIVAGVALLSVPFEPLLSIERWRSGLGPQSTPRQYLEHVLAESADAKDESRLLGIDRAEYVKQLIRLEASLKNYWPAMLGADVDARDWLAKQVDVEGLQTEWAALDEVRRQHDDWWMWGDDIEQVPEIARSEYQKLLEVEEQLQEQFTRVPEYVDFQDMQALYEKARDFYFDELDGDYSALLEAEDSESWWDREVVATTLRPVYDHLGRLKDTAALAVVALGLFFIGSGLGELGQRVPNHR